MIVKNNVNMVNSTTELFPLITITISTIRDNETSNRPYMGLVDSISK